MYIDLFGDVGVQCQERSTMKSAIANALQPLKSIDATTDMGHNALHIFFIQFYLHLERCFSNHMTVSLLEFI